VDGEVVFRAYLNGYKVIPCVRMTRRGKHATQRARDYNKQQAEMADQFTAVALEHKVECPVKGQVSIDIVAGYEDRRKRDGTNIVKAVEDALVFAGVLKDDSVSYVPQGQWHVKLGRKQAYLIVQLRRVVIKNEG